MIRHFTTERQKLGERGEHIALEYLLRKGYSLITRNYSTKDGEIDIICIKDSVLYFIEVKTISIRHPHILDQYRYKPEYNVSREKLIKMQLCAETYVFEHNTHLSDQQVSCETRFGAVLIEIDDTHNRSYIRFMRNIIIENENSGDVY